MGRQERPDLSELAARVSRARADVTAARDRVPAPGSYQTTGAQRELLMALEAYEEGLTVLGFPLTYSLRTELAMYQNLLQVPRARRDASDAAWRRGGAPEPRR